jgi:hypothetical protein
VWIFGFIFGFGNTTSAGDFGVRDDGRPARVADRGVVFVRSNTSIKRARDAVWNSSCSPELGV